MNGEIAVTIRDRINKQSITLMAPLSTKVGALKNCVLEQWDISFGQQHLQFENSFLKDQSMLSDFMTEDSEGEIQLVGRKERFNFSDLSQKQEQNTVTATDPLSPYIVKSGLILRAKCKNQQCNAWRQKALVCINKGFGEFQLGKLLWSGKCPLCQQKTTRVENIGYYKTKIILSGIKANGQEYYLSEDTKKGKFHTFKDSCDTTTWDYHSM